MLVGSAVLLLVRTARTAFERPLAPPTGAEGALLAELADAFESIPALDPDTEFPASETAWRQNIVELRHHVLHDDPREFLRWPVVERTMFLTTHERMELRFLKDSSEWEVRWRSALKEDQVGHPTPSPFYPSSSGNRIHHAYHLARFERELDLRVDQLSLVLEFGGGYGGMCRLIHRLGFRGRYLLYDLPEFSALQASFLFAYQDHFGEVNNVEWFNQLQQLDSDVDWVPSSIEHLPGNSYLFGRIADG
jgi:hypothetical protein